MLIFTFPDVNTDVAMQAKKKNKTKIYISRGSATNQGIIAIGPVMVLPTFSNFFGYEKNAVVFQPDSEKNEPNNCQS